MVPPSKIPSLQNGPKKLNKTLITFLIPEDVDILVREGKYVMRLHNRAEFVCDVLEVERVVLFYG
jgi:hypothetical protein